MEVELDLSNYATKANLKKRNRRQYITVAKKYDLADKFYVDKLKNVPSRLSSLKNKIDKSDIGKSEATPTDLSKPTRCSGNFG